MFHLWFKKYKAKCTLGLGLKKSNISMKNTVKSVSLSNVKTNKRSLGLGLSPKTTTKNPHPVSQCAGWPGRQNSGSRPLCPRPTRCPRGTRRCAAPWACWRAGSASGTARAGCRTSGGTPRTLWSGWHTWPRVRFSRARHRPV